MNATIICLTGVDWKSLTISGCLPITTDYFPDRRALQIDYVVSLYNLLPDDVNADFAQQRVNNKKPLSTVEVFKELVSQRLAQGFQLILLPNCNEQLFTSSQIVSNTGSLLRKRPVETEDSETYHLSIGRIFHKISLSGNAITVTRYRPRYVVLYSMPQAYEYIFPILFIAFFWSQLTLVILIATFQL